MATTLLYRNLGGGKFREVAAEAGVQQKLHAVGASWGDADNDGDLDLFVAAYVDGDNGYSRAHLFMNEQGRFTDALGEEQSASRGGPWRPVGGFRPGRRPGSRADRRFSGARPPSAVAERVAEGTGRAARCRSRCWIARAAPRAPALKCGLYASDGKLLGTRLVPTGDGYGSQSVVPVHFGLASMEVVTVEVTFLTREGRKKKRIANVDPREWAGRALVVKAD